MSHPPDGGSRDSDVGPSGSSPARSTRVRRNCPWTEAEHRLFLLGLEKYGRGSWRNIAAEFVTTRTATQVASHAQKYFLRDSAANQIRKRQRPSIHDIRSSSSVPSTQLEQEQLKSSLQRINKQSMELEMNAASDFHGGAFGYASVPQSQLSTSVDDPSQSALFQGHYPLSQDQGPSQSFWPPGQSESQILAQNVLRGLLNSPFQLADLNTRTHGHIDGVPGNSGRAQQFATHAVTAPAAGHPTSDPNPMGSFARQPPSSMGGPGTPSAAAAQSALLSQQLHAAANNEGDPARSSGAQPQRVWSVADMATSLGLERLYQQGDRQQPAPQNPVEALYGTNPERQRSHSSVAASLNTANALRASGGLPQQLSQAQQAPPQRISMGGEEPSSNGQQHLQLNPAAVGPQACFTGGGGPPQGAPVDPSQVGAAGNDPFLQLLQGLKVAKALQGAGEGEEPQHQDSHYRALVQMLAQRNAQMAPPTRSLPAANTCSTGMHNNSAGAASASSVPHHPTPAQEAVHESANRGLHSVFNSRLNAAVGSQGTIAGLEDMHALASLVAHSAGTPAAQGGYAGLPVGLGGGVKPEPHLQSGGSGGGSAAEMLPGSVPMQASAAPPPPFNGGHGGSWDVGIKQMQDMPPQFHEALSRLHASAHAGRQWPNPSDSSHSANPP